MARALFHGGVDSLPLDDQCRLSSSLMSFKIGMHNIVANPTTGGWVEVFDEEIYALRPGQEISGTVASFCAEAGLVDVVSAKSREHDSLYFFEFVVTPSCNLGCTYCFAGASPQMKSSVASKELCHKFIDRIAEYKAETRTSRRLVIEFTGGEPLLAADTIRDMINYARDTYGEGLGVDYVMQSNFTALSKSAVDLMKNYPINVGISCDGYASIHNEQRPLASNKNSHFLVEKNLKWFKSTHPDKMGGVICVIDPSNARQIPELLLYFHTLGCNHLIFRPLEQIGRGGGLKISQQEDYIEGLLDGLVSVISPVYSEYKILIYEQYLSLTFKHLLGAQRPFMCERSPCGGGSSICVTNTDGNVYTCHQATAKDKFKMGSIWNESFLSLLESEAAEVLRCRSASSIDSCRSCVFRSWCGSACAITAEAKHGSIYAPIADCKINKHRYTRAISLLLEDGIDLNVVSALIGSDQELTWRHHCLI